MIAVVLQSQPSHRPTWTTQGLSSEDVDSHIPPILGRSFPPLANEFMYLLHMDSFQVYLRCRAAPM